VRIVRTFEPFPEPILPWGLIRANTVTANTVTANTVTAYLLQQIQLLTHWDRYGLAPWSGPIQNRVSHVFITARCAAEVRWLLSGCYS
jgi:hypothetical protein